MERGEVGMGEGGRAGWRERKGSCKVVNSEGFHLWSGI